MIRKVLFSLFILGASLAGLSSCDDKGKTPDNPIPETPTSGEEGKDEEGYDVGYEYVDLGLSVLWATCNVGAENPEDNGKYFAWGETKGYSKEEAHEFNWANYFDNPSGDGKTFNIYKKNGEKELKPEHDAARKNLGGKWRMPSKTEFEELKQNCEWTWDNEKKGYKIKSKTDDSFIFLPVVGYRRDGSLNGDGTLGHYWSRSLEEQISEYAWYTDFNDFGVNVLYDVRYRGCSVRPVLDKK